MTKITTIDLLNFMELFHHNNDGTYKSVNKGFNTVAYLSSNFAGILFIVNDNKDFTSNFYEVNDEKICEVFGDFSGRESFREINEIKEYIEFSDIKGFTSNGWYIFKGVEDFKWNRYTASKDQKEIKEAILRAGQKHQGIHNNFIEYGFTANFNGEIISKLNNGGFVGRISHKGMNRFVVFNQHGKCYDIYPDKQELIKWEKYDLKKITP